MCVAERDQFVTLTRQNFFDAKNEQAESMNKTTKERFDAIMKQQSDAAYLKDNFMPKVVRHSTYDAPAKLRHRIEMRHENMFVVTNHEHSKQTNNGYKRGVLGGFFCH